MSICHRAGSRKDRAWGPEPHRVGLGMKVASSWSHKLGPGPTRRHKDQPALPILALLVPRDSPWPGSGTEF